ncbi:MAG TPA: amidohydrolase family protein [Polyangiaceae bacterium]|nr:amidohydrolase family protein [Polyangiaceae bacterium]
MKTSIINVRVFDGESVRPEASVHLFEDRILGLGGQAPSDSEIVDGKGGTLLPGLIDAHVHTDESGLALALQFGVTTELEMQGVNTRNDRMHITHDDTLADVRSSGFALTPPGGHPSELFPEDFDPSRLPRRRERERVSPLVQAKVSTPREAETVIPELIAGGSDYIKFMIDDGCVEGHPGLPMLDYATLSAGVREARKRGMLTLAHALTLDATRMAVEAGIHGLTHLFMDVPHTREVVDTIARSGAFMVPCVVLNASMMGINGASLADDPRVAPHLNEAWDATLRSSFNHYPQGKFEDQMASVKALHDAGVELLVGTDVSQPFPFLGGLAHGASVHHELQYLVQAGLSPIQALRAATASTARRFGLLDRGRIAPGLRADLVLIEGEPTRQISDTLNVRSVWRRGTHAVNRPSSCSW